MRRKRRCTGQDVRKECEGSGWPERWPAPFSGRSDLGAVAPERLLQSGRYRSGCLVGVATGAERLTCRMRVVPYV